MGCKMKRLSDLFPLDANVTAEDFLDKNGRLDVEILIHSMIYDLRSMSSMSSDYYYRETAEILKKYIEAVINLERGNL